MSYQIFNNLTKEFRGLNSQYKKNNFILNVQEELECIKMENHRKASIQNMLVFVAVLVGLVAVVGTIVESNDGIILQQSLMLGGVTLMIVSCVLSFEFIINMYPRKIKHKLVAYENFLEQNKLELLHPSVMEKEITEIMREIEYNGNKNRKEKNEYIMNFIAIVTLSVIMSLVLYYYKENFASIYCIITIGLIIAFYQKNIKKLLPISCNKIKDENELINSAKESILLLGFIVYFFAQSYNIYNSSEHDLKFITLIDIYKEIFLTVIMAIAITEIT